MIVNGSAEKPSFGLLETLDLSRHIDIRDLDKELPEDKGIEQILTTVSNEQFQSDDRRPPCKVILSSLPDQNGSATRVLVFFASTVMASQVLHSIERSSKACKTQLPESKQAKCPPAGSNLPWKKPASSHCHGPICSRPCFESICPASWPER